MTLERVLRGRSPDATLWIRPHGSCAVRSVLARTAALAARLDASRIALALADDERMAIALLAAERQGATMLLVPAAWDQATYDRYAARAGVELLVTDRPELSDKRVVRVFDEEVCFTDEVVISANRARWIIPTSGTTGAPKLVEHSLDSLARTVKTDAGKGASLVWGLIYELSRFAGLQVFLQAMLGGSRLVFVDRAATMDRIVEQLHSAECNALSGTPTFWRRLSMARGSDRLPLRLATLGGETADTPILKTLAYKFPQAKVIHIYASTEAGVGFSVRDGIAGFPATFLRNPPSGVEVKVDSEGMLWLRTADAAASFVGENAALVEVDGWIRTGDLVRREGDRFVFLGRANGAINVGGNKVFPEEVEDCIRRVEGVSLVTVRARANPITGALVEACVKPAPEADRNSLKRLILESCRASLAAYQVPALITWVDDIAVNATGKIIRS